MPAPVPREFVNAVHRQRKEERNEGEESTVESSSYFDVPAT